MESEERMIKKDREERGRGKEKQIIWRKRGKEMKKRKGMERRERMIEKDSDQREKENE